MKESVRRLRTFVASVNWVEVGGVSGSLSMLVKLYSRDTKSRV